MKIEFKNIQSHSSIEEAFLQTNSIAYHGDAIDERGEAALELLNQYSDQCIKIHYNDEEFVLTIDSISYNKDDFTNYFSESIQAENIIIEATTLSFAEILYLLKSCLQNSFVETIQILYIEPSEYKFKNTSMTSYDEFALSDRFKEYPPLPGFTINAEYNDVDLIAFLGFEKSRLGQIFTLDETIYPNFIPVIPLPGFSPGWENRTINNHIKFFTDKYFFSELKYVSANNPYQAYKLLESLAQTKPKFRIAPIGTKPNAIGCAVFLVNTESEEIQYGVLFDFPVKTKKRSEGIGKTHIYNLIKA